ncbi:MAG: hypothetical protein ACPLPR_09610, partial [Bacillota bacterium]
RGQLPPSYFGQGTGQVAEAMKGNSADDEGEIRCVENGKYATAESETCPAKTPPDPDSAARERPYSRSLRRSEVLYSCSPLQYNQVRI